jgi:peroxiredoxin
MPLFSGAALLACACMACGSEMEPPGAPRPAQARAAGGVAPSSGGAAAAESAAPDEKRAQRKERPLPGFSGWTLEGERFSVSSALGKRLLIFFFNPDVTEAAVIAEAVAKISPLRGAHNFEILGVATGSSREAAQAFAARRALDFRVLDDSSAGIARRMGLRAPIAILGIDPEGYVVFGFAQFETQAPNASQLIHSRLRTALRLPGPEGDAMPGTRPLAPDFEADVLDGNERFTLAARRGEPVVLIFFLHTCPHCHEALRFLKAELGSLSQERRPVLVGVELTGKTHAVRANLREGGFDFFPVLFDDDGSIVNAYGVFAGVPDVILIDREGRIAARVQGWEPQTDEPLLRMRLAKLVGAPVPMLLSKKGYSGSEVCGVCHESEHATWLLTSHASAFDTLVRHGADTDAECVGCHVVGYGARGGFLISPATKRLENVGCESCHGRGGSHLSPDFAPGDDYASACAGCHDEKHSLAFDYAAFLPRVSHADNAHILELPAPERRRTLAERGAARRELLPAAAAHVGSEACRSCHAAEFETWAAGPHAAATATLAKSGRDREPPCLKCHTTGFGRTGGFPSTGSPVDHPDLARVGCESCHGPGAKHLEESSAKRGSIVSLGNKCDSCVILQICGTCHDADNDPGFEFEVKSKIEKIRHGTVELGSGHSLPTGEFAAGPRAVPTAADERAALLSRAFALLDRYARGAR